MATTLVRIQQRRKTAAAWTSSAEVLLPGELGIETDTLKVKIGDGVTAWAALAYHGTTAAPTGTAGGDLTGTYPNPTLAVNRLTTANNLSDLASAATARTNLGLKSGATVAITVSTTAPASPATNDLWVDAN